MILVLIVMCAFMARLGLSTREAPQPEPTPKKIANTPSATPLQVSVPLTGLNINGVFVGMSRQEVERLYDGLFRESQRGFTHFGILPGTGGYGNGSEICFSTAGQVTVVSGVNLFKDSKPVCEERWRRENLSKPDPRRASLLKALGRPSSLNVLEGQHEIWCYPSLSLIVKTHPKYPWRFALGTQDAQDLR